MRAIYKPCMHITTSQIFEKIKLKGTKKSICNTTKAKLDETTECNIETMHACILPQARFWRKLN